MEGIEATLIADLFLTVLLLNTATESRIIFPKDRADVEDFIRIRKLREAGYSAFHVTQIYEKQHATYTSSSALTPECLSRRKRDTQNADSKLSINIDTHGELFEIELRHVKSVLHPAATVTFGSHDNPWPWSGEHPDCFMRGHVTSHGGAAIISFCDNLTGAFSVGNYSFNFETLPYDDNNYSPGQSIQHHVLVARKQISSIDIYDTNTPYWDNENVVPLLKRTRRATTPYIVEIGIWADEKMTQYLEDIGASTESEKIQRMIMKWNGVQADWALSVLGYNIELQIKNMTFWSTDPDWYRTWYTRTGTIPLSNGNSAFCADLPASDYNADHLQMHTGVTNTDVSGYAYQTNACSSSYKCAISKEREPSDYYVSSHELGHQLGMRHDSDLNCNPPDVGIMGTATTGWSTCSVNSLQNFLNSGQSSCLTSIDISDTEVPTKLKNVSVTIGLPGMVYSLDEVCQFEFGSEFMHRPFPYWGDCTWYSCIDMSPGTSFGTMINVPYPLVGRECGDEMVCTENNVCTNWNDTGLPYSSFKPVQGGWGAWGSWTTTCSRTCGTGFKLRTRICNSPSAVLTTGCDGYDVEAEACSKTPCGTDSTTESTLIAQRATETCTALVNNGILDSGSYDGSGTQFYSSGLGQCEVQCAAIPSGNQRFGLMPDGTPCASALGNIADDNNWPRKSGLFSACVRGQCYPIGCDDRLGPTSFDGCGVCGGSETTCDVYEGVFTDLTIRGFRTDFGTLPSGSYNIQFWFTWSTMKQVFIEVWSKDDTVVLASRLSPPWIWDTTGTDAEPFHAGTYWAFKYSTQYLYAYGPTNEDVKIKIYQHGLNTNLGINYAYSVQKDTTTAVPTTADPTTAAQTQTSTAPTTSTSATSAQTTFEQTATSFERITTATNTISTPTTYEPTTTASTTAKTSKPTTTASTTAGPTTAASTEAKSTNPITITTSQPTTIAPTTSELTMTASSTAEPPPSISTTTESTTSTIASPATSVPTTAEPTTTESTTAEPTTSESTTSELITSKSTTDKPTTPEPTASESKTAESTTSKSPTSEPTSSSVYTTYEPTTTASTKAEPPTSVSKTSKSTTTASTTAEPTPSEPTSESSSTEPTISKSTTSEPTKLVSTTTDTTTTATITVKPTDSISTAPEPRKTSSTMMEPTTFVPTTSEPTTALTTSEPTMSILTISEQTSVITTTTSTTFQPTTYESSSESTTSDPTASTAVEPTTSEPTTSVSIASEPVTTVSTRAEPPTSVSTTSEATSTASTTSEQTTSGPITVDPTTASTSVQPTTSESTTTASTMVEQTTSKSTPEPTTSLSTTTASETAEPPTSVRTSEPTTTASTTSEQPTSKSTAAEEMTSASSSAKQATQQSTPRQTVIVPTTSEPTTSEPTTSVSTTVEPTTSETTTSESTAEPPTSVSTTSEATSTASTTSEQTTSKPITSKSTTHKTTTSEPTTSESTTSESTAYKSTTSKSTTAEPRTSESFTSEQTSEPTTSEPFTSEQTTSGSTTTTQTTATTTLTQGTHVSSEQSAVSTISSTTSAPTTSSSTTAAPTSTATRDAQATTALTTDKSSEKDSTTTAMSTIGAPTTTSTTEGPTTAAPTTAPSPTTLPTSTPTTVPLTITAPTTAVQTTAAPTTTAPTTAAPTTAAPTMAAPTTAAPECTLQELQCSDGRCMDESLFCDGNNDCGDDSDELDPDCSGGVLVPVANSYAIMVLTVLYCIVR